MVDDDSIPEWARPLFSGPVNLGEISTQELTSVVEAKLTALLKLYECDATADGWRRLALILVTQHQFAGMKVMDVKRSDDRPVGSVGRPADPNFWLWVAEIAMLFPSREKSVKAAAEKVHRKYRKHPELKVPTARRLENIFAASKRRSLLPNSEVDLEMLKALYTAANRLESCVT